MATAVLLASGRSTTDNFSTGTISGIGTNTQCVMAVVTARSGLPDGHTVTGGGVTTWTSIGTQVFESRRLLELFEASDVPDGTAITIDETKVTGTFYETHWYLIELAEFNATDWSASAIVSTEQNSGTQMDSPTVGALTGDEIALFFGAVQLDGQTTAAASGSTLLNDLDPLDSSNGIRYTVAGYSTTDDTPGFTYTTDDDAAIMAVRVSDGTDGSHAGGTNTSILVPTGPLR